MSTTYRLSRVFDTRYCLSYFMQHLCIYYTKKLYIHILDCTGKICTNLYADWRWFDLAIAFHNFWGLRDQNSVVDTRSHKKMKMMLISSLWFISSLDSCSIPLISCQIIFIHNLYPNKNSWKDLANLQWQYPALVSRRQSSRLYWI